MKDTENMSKNAVLKRLTLSAWAKILLDEGKIDIKKYNRMIEKIDKISA